MVGGKCVAVATNMCVEGGTGGVRSVEGGTEANVDEADVLYQLQPRRTAPAVLRDKKKMAKKSEGSGIHVHQRRPWQIKSTPLHAT